MDKGFENMAYGLLGLPHAGYKNPEEAVQMAGEKQVCSSCGENRAKLREALHERAWFEWPNPTYGGFQGHTDAGIKAKILIEKCSECQEYFFGGNNG